MEMPLLKVAEDGATEEVLFAPPTFFDAETNDIIAQAESQFTGEPWELVSGQSYQVTKENNNGK